MDLYQVFIEPLTYSWMIKGLLISILVSLSCGLLGVFLVLRKMALFGDALSHVVLPGIVIAFLLSDSRSSLPLLLGAGAIGFITTILINAIHTRSKVKEDASIGIVFTVMFALGVILLTSQAAHVDLDPDCILYGNILGVPQSAIWVMGFVTIAVIIGIALFHKQLLVTSFDPLLASSLGISAALVNYIFMGSLSLVLVTSFETVGSILVVAMLIAPGAAAYLWSDRLRSMLILAAIFSVSAAVIGIYVSVWIDCSPAGAIVLIGFIIFLISLLVSPKYGIINRKLQSWKLSRRILHENILKSVYRVNQTNDKITASELADNLMVPLKLLNRGIKNLASGKLLNRSGDYLELSPLGMAKGEKMLRYHRLWEVFLSKEFQLPDDHLHADAEDIEHFITPELEKQLTEYLDSPEIDPHGSVIPSGRE